MQPSLREITYSGILILLIGAAPTAAQPSTELTELPEVSVYAKGLVGPLGLEFDGRGRLWVAEPGWKGDQAREAQVLNALFPLLDRNREATLSLFDLVKNQPGY